MYLHASCAAGCGNTHVDEETGICDECRDEERLAAGPDENDEEDL